MRVQFKHTRSGKVAILPLAEFERLKAIEREAEEDEGTIRIVRQARKEIEDGAVLLPLSIIDSLADGKSAIRVLRKWRGMTQEELSVSVGIPQGYMSDIETGKRKGPLELHRKFARALGVQLDVLVGESVTEEQADPQRFKNRRKAITEIKRNRVQR